MSDDTPTAETSPSDGAEAAQQARSASAASGPLPRPDFKMFLSGLAGQAVIHLGLAEDPSTGKREKDLDKAKYTIDLLQVVKEKTQGNLDAEEQKLLDGMLYDLRMRYVEACR